MKLPLSRRLLCCTQFVRPGDRVADVGCDHGYLGIYLLKQGLASFVIASDINEGPLHSAFLNARKFGVQEQMSFHLSDGLRNVPREFDTLVCAGMGGLTMISILENAPWLQDSRYHLILQCQAKTPLLRRFLWEHGWHISREVIVRDGRFLYTVMDVLREPGHSFTPGDCYLSPALRRENQPELPEYYERMLKGLKKAVEGHGPQAVPFQAAALRQLTETSLIPKEDPYDNSERYS